MTGIRIRDEAPEDVEAIRRVNDAAFGQEGEGRLVDELRRQGAAVISLVAEVDGQVVGHILFSPVVIEGGDEATRPDGILGLAPMAVLPEHQRHGLGGRLIRAGLDRCREVGAALVVVLGHPEYYPRFGFVPAPPLGVTCEYPVPDEVFMVQELEPGALEGRRGLARYHPAFAAV
jgi:putative acetyltransferase